MPDRIEEINPLDIEDFSAKKEVNLEDLDIDLEVAMKDVSDDEGKEIAFPEDLTGFAAGFPDWALLPPNDYDAIIEEKDLPKKGGKKAAAK